MFGSFGFGGGIVYIYIYIFHTGISGVLPESKKMRGAILSWTVPVSGREAEPIHEETVFLQKGPRNRLCTTTIYVLPPSMYCHRLCTTTVYVLPLSMYSHRLCTTTVYVLPLSMHYHRLCTTTVYVLPPSMYYHRLCTESPTQALL